MNGNSFVVDTNVVLQLINKDDVLASLLNSKLLYISFITELELLSYKNLTQIQRTEIEELLSDCFIIDINARIKKIVVDLRFNYKLKLPDAIIAATSSYLNIPLITSDRDFKKISNLNIYFYER